MSAVIGYIWLIIQLLVGYNLVLPVLLYLLYRLRKKREVSISQPAGEPDYAVIITAYEQTQSVPAAVNSILAAEYSNYLIYIVADNCDVSGLHFDDERVIVLRPEEVLKSNVKSHFYAIDRFRRPHTHLTIVDSDNLVHRAFFTECNRFFDQGFSAVQGFRRPRNLDTPIACLDAARDIYYHFYDGEVLFALGSSAALSGSGMAFTTELYRDCLAGYSFSGAGFDKVLQYAIVKRGYRIACAPEAVVFDEKTSQADQLENQRARWINTWFKYFRFGFSLLAKGITRFNPNQFLFGLMLVRPPLFIFLVLAMLCLLVNLVSLSWGALWWLLGFGLFIGGFLLALIRSHADKRIFASLRNIPRFMFIQLRSLIRARRANQRSVSTQHYHTTTINEIKPGTHED